MAVTAPVATSAKPAGSRAASAWYSSSQGPVRTVSRAGPVPGLRSTTDLPDGSYAGLWTACPVA